MHCCIYDLVAFFRYDLVAPICLHIYLQVQTTFEWVLNSGAQRIIPIMSKFRNWFKICFYCLYSSVSSGFLDLLLKVITDLVLLIQQFWLILCSRVQASRIYQELLQRGKSLTGAQQTLLRQQLISLQQQHQLLLQQMAHQGEPSRSDIAAAAAVVSEQQHAMMGSGGRSGSGSSPVPTTKSENVMDNISIWGGPPSSKSGRQSELQQTFLIHKCLKSIL